MISEKIVVVDNKGEIRNYTKGYYGIYDWLDCSDSEGPEHVYIKVFFDSKKEFKGIIVDEITEGYIYRGDIKDICDDVCRNFNEYLIKNEIYIKENKVIDVPYSN